MPERAATKLNYEPYKEPLTKVVNGHGYIGVVARSVDNQTIQCHICGGMYAHLGNHAKKKHNVGHLEYKERFELSRLTPLISPELRNRYIAATANAPEALKRLRLKNLADNQGRARHPRWSKSLEQKNREGICPDQLIRKIQDLSATLNGATPTSEQFRKHYKGCVRAVYNTFGSWNNAVKVAGLPGNPRGRRGLYSKPTLTEMVQRFKKIHGRRPYSSDLGRELPTQWVFHKYFGSFSKAIKEAGV